MSQKEIYPSGETPGARRPQDRPGHARSGRPMSRSGYEDRVLTSGEARAAIGRILRQFRTEGAFSPPVVFGADRIPEAVIIPAQLFEMLQPVIERRVQAHALPVIEAYPWAAQLGDEERAWFSEELHILAADPALASSSPVALATIRGWKARAEAHAAGLQSRDIQRIDEPIPVDDPRGRDDG